MNLLLSIFIALASFSPSYCKAFDILIEYFIVLTSYSQIAWIMAVDSFLEKNCSIIPYYVNGGYINSYRLQDYSK